MSVKIESKRQLLAYVGEMTLADLVEYIDSFSESELNLSRYVKIQASIEDRGIANPPKPCLVLQAETRTW